MLRGRTSAHIRAIARDREYLIARYGPDCLSTASQMNRLLATLEEVARKVSRAVADGVPSQPIPRRGAGTTTEAEGRPVHSHLPVAVDEVQLAGLRAGIGRYIGFYNAVRPHSALGGRKPDQRYFNQPLLAAA